MADAEIVDSGQDRRWGGRHPGSRWFWATVRNLGPATDLEVRLELLHRQEVIQTDRQTRSVGADTDEVYAFRVPVPKRADQYRFSIVGPAAEPGGADHPEPDSGRTRRSRD